MPWKAVAGLLYGGRDARTRAVVSPAHGTEPGDAARVSLVTIVREWGRIGCTGFGGPPAHIALVTQAMRR